MLHSWLKHRSACSSRSSRTVLNGELAISEVASLASGIKAVTVLSPCNVEERSTGTSSTLHKSAAMCTSSPAEGCLNTVKHNPELEEVLISIFVSGCRRWGQTGPAETFLVNLQNRDSKEGNADSEVVFTFLSLSGSAMHNVLQAF